MTSGSLMMSLWTLLFPAVPASGALINEPPAPQHSLTVSDDKGEYAWRRAWSDGSMASEQVLKIGALALTESFPYPYPILKRSPYVMGGVKRTYSNGPIEEAVILTAGAVNLNSQRLYDDPQGLLGSSANWNHDREISQNQAVVSAYVDKGRTFEAGGWKGAVFAALDQFAFMPVGGSSKHGGASMTEANAGMAWLKRDGPHEVSLSADAAFELARRKFYRNEFDFEAAPSGKAGLEYAYQTDAKRYLAGVEAQTRRADSSLRPYLGIEKGGMAAMLATEFRESKDPFFPDSRAVAVSFKARAADSLSWGVTARSSSERYAMAPGPEHTTRVTAELTWTPDAHQAVQSAKSAASRYAQEFEAQKQRDLQAQASASATQNEIRALIAASPTLADFYKAYKPNGSLGVLAAAAEFTGLFSQYNYNENEGHPDNLQNVGDIYQRARQSYLSGTDDPTLVCLGAAQFAAAAAIELGRLNGVPIEAAGVTMNVSDSKGKQSGHAVAVVKTREYGIVFVDWGRVTPTYTWNTEKALRLYQALGGQPALYHQITDPTRDGRHVGYLFTEEGKLLVNNLTFHGEAATPAVGELFADDPRGDQVTVERYKRVLRQKP
ncbi:MAG: hypothetical protein A2V88_02915 [Elusimicrobia bacterium RBG_16_66_12]|nr:MAG: hypothetical protein A2V88_02915 [Elusimicrobia bacterium RBG_16_66_12]